VADAELSPGISTAGENGGASSIETSTDDGWRRDSKEREYVPRRGRSGVIYRQGTETVDEARARDAKGPKEKPPKPKPRPKPPAPSKPTLKELEHELAEALSMPSMVCAMKGDTWAANHFTKEGPILARNLVTAAEHNTWLRAKLEAALSGEELLVKLITAMGVAGALFAYAIPPMIFYVNPPFVSKETREMFGVPERKKEADAPSAPPTEAPEPIEAFPAAA
jgi:hypothetical protein